VREFVLAGAVDIHEMETILTCSLLSQFTRMYGAKGISDKLKA